MPPEGTETVNPCNLGVNVNDSEAPYTAWILAGVKRIETRGSRRNALAGQVGRRIAIVRTGRGPAQVVGYATVGEPIEYATRAAWDADASRHRVAPGSRYDWDGWRVGYPMIDVEPCEPFAPAGRGIQTRRIF